MAGAVNAQRHAAMLLPPLAEALGPLWRDGWRPPLPEPAPECHQAGRWTLDARARKLICGECVNSLPSAETDILALLLQNPGQTVSHAALHAAGWPADPPSHETRKYYTKLARAIFTLRGKLGTHEAARLETEFGRGYRWAASQDSSAAAPSMH